MSHVGCLLRNSIKAILQAPSRVQGLDFSGSINSRPAVNTNFDDAQEAGGSCPRAVGGASPKLEALIDRNASCRNMTRNSHHEVPGFVLCALST